mmetsp:Transcript_13179/g.21850  ORF Transcript_13179/g.21850 Transcript_13179/m.21850 type:complete len:219 (-) Transcript_13179:33-689(-)|eukprot:CAMPEP_0119014514 /NCGR_PEP_ID=MMETSP1176-20130426/9871_1 /TAXON_ID=265551 /ORGANISM="Synedropsis recta cf, Strain CCMP1620" /LENGTH=218 /DNA_ID=CAMNT_0006967703 /DNA_START=112 /DNA_END=768 /DNA_ORIENTATION=+
MVRLASLLTLFVAAASSLDMTLGAESCSDSSQVLVQKLDALPSSNGCSKPSGISVGGEEDFTYCCDRHDVCYSTCGISKDQCENDFGKCMKHLCKSAFSSNPQCAGAAQMYQMGTTMFGGSGFTDLQNDYCVCIPKSDVASHYTKLLRKVYKGHSTKSETEITETITKLIIKAGETPSVRMLGNLFYKILKKYDSAIQHEGKRVGAKPPRPKAAKQEL